MLIEYSLFPLLDYLPYNKNSAILELKQRFNFQKYEVKHGESIFTRFYQCYILPEKFGIDKRRLHLSNLIASGQETKS